MARLSFKFSFAKIKFDSSFNSPERFLSIYKIIIIMYDDKIVLCNLHYISKASSSKMSLFSHQNFVQNKVLFLHSKYLHRKQSKGYLTKFA